MSLTRILILISYSTLVAFVRSDEYADHSNIFGSITHYDCTEVTDGNSYCYYTCVEEYIHIRPSKMKFHNGKYTGYSELFAYTYWGEPQWEPPYCEIDCASLTSNNAHRRINSVQIEPGILKSEYENAASNDQITCYEKDSQTVPEYPCSRIVPDYEDVTIYSCFIGQNFKEICYYTCSNYSYFTGLDSIRLSNLIIGSISCSQTTWQVPECHRPCHAKNFSDLKKGGALLRKCNYFNLHKVYCLYLCNDLYKNSNEYTSTYLEEDGLYYGYASCNDFNHKEMDPPSCNRIDFYDERRIYIKSVELGNCVKEGVEIPYCLYSCPPSITYKIDPYHTPLELYENAWDKFICGTNCDNFTQSKVTNLQCYDLATNPGLQYCTMEYCDGSNDSEGICQDYNGEIIIYTPKTCYRSTTETYNNDNCSDFSTMFIKDSTIFSCFLNANNTRQCYYQCTDMDTYEFPLSVETVDIFQDTIFGISKCESGVWTNPICNKKCDLPPNFAQWTFDMTGCESGKSFYNNTDTCTYSCKYGNFIGMSINTLSFACVDGNWIIEGHNISSLQCPTLCSSLPEFPAQQILNYECDEEEMRGRECRYLCSDLFDTNAANLARRNIVVDNARFGVTACDNENGVNWITPLCTPINFFNTQRRFINDQTDPVLFDCQGEEYCKATCSSETLSPFGPWLTESVKENSEFAFPIAEFYKNTFDVPECLSDCSLLEKSSYLMSKQCTLKYKGFYNCEVSQCENKACAFNADAPKSTCYEKNEFYADKSFKCRESPPLIKRGLYTSCLVNPDGIFECDFTCDNGYVSSTASNTTKCVGENGWESHSCNSYCPSIENGVVYSVVKDDTEFDYMNGNKSQIICWSGKVHVLNCFHGYWVFEDSTLFDKDDLSMCSEEIGVEFSVYEENAENQCRKIYPLLRSEHGTIIDSPFRDSNGLLKLRYKCIDDFACMPVDFNGDGNECLLTCNLGRWSKGGCFQVPPQFSGNYTLDINFVDGVLGSVFDSTGVVIASIGDDE